jgi:hypothetical protein
MKRKTDQKEEKKPPHERSYFLIDSILSAADIKGIPNN